MRVIAFHPKYNARDKKDVTGAFQPECRKFIQVHNAHVDDIHIIDNRKSFAKRGQQVVQVLDSYAGKQLESVAFFCHGWQTGMQLGFNKGNVNRLAEAIYAACERTNINVPLYLCSTGGGDNHGATSFADALRDALCQRGASHCRVMGHRTVAHTTKNPQALFFDGMGSTIGGVGGYDVVESGSELWKAWRQALQGREAPFSDFRFRFPYMSVAEIHAQLAGSDIVPTPIAAETPKPLMYRVTDDVALIRTGPPGFHSTGKVVPLNALVFIRDTKGRHARVVGVDGTDYKWTLRSNVEAAPQPDPIPQPISPPPVEIPLPIAPLSAPEEDIYTVIDKKALIRSGAPRFRSINKKIPRYTRVRIISTHTKYARVVGLDGKDYRWTALSNLYRYYRDAVQLVRVALAASDPVAIDDSWSQTQKALAKVFNRLGGLITALACETRVHPAGVMAVWRVESGGRVHTPNKAIIRFENHLLYKRWGKDNQKKFDQHFCFGGRNGVPGSSWKNHAFRANTEEEFRSFHGKQALEYQVLDLACQLAGENTALKCISMGGPQILGAHYRRLGYATPVEMFQAFQADERAHVLGFFDFCEGADKRGDLISKLRRKDWTGFACGYNGKGKADLYGDRIKDAFAAGKRILKG